LCVSDVDGANEVMTSMR